MVTSSSKPEDKKPTQTLEELTAKKSTSPTRTSGDSEADKEKGKADYVKPEDVPNSLGDNTSTTRAPETIEADKAHIDELQAIANRQKEIDEEVEKEKKKSKLHKVGDIGHGRKVVITNDTDKALEEIGLAPHNVDVINNGAVVWTGDLADRYIDDLIADNKVVASQVENKKND